MKNKLDNLVKKYETTDFIKDDPIQFPHRGKNKREIELYGFIASLFAYGNRKMFIGKLNEIFQFCDNDIENFIKNSDFKCLKNIEYRFAKNNDIIPIFQILSDLYNNNSNLKELFEKSWQDVLNIENQQDKYTQFFQKIIDYFYNKAPNTVGQGFYHMLPNPKNGGAMKRMNMLLRWFVRKSDVDLGIWNFMNTFDLLIPLDVHVARISRQMNLLQRKSNDFKAVLELTNKLKEFSKEDPIKYDFAMFAFGVELNKNNGETLNVL